MAEYFQSLKGKVALITGASSGIGAATAVEFSKNGMKLMIHGRDEGRLREVAQKCTKAGAAQVELVTGDIAVEEDVKRIGEATLQKFGTLHVLINNAGGSAGGTMDNSSLEDMDIVYKQHIRAPFQLIKFFQEELIKNKGSIVNTSSWLAECKNTFLFPLGVTFPGTKALTEMVAVELGRKGVRCNALGPGFTTTAAFKTSGHCQTVEQSEKFFESMGKYTALNQSCSPEEMARTILFMVSDAAPSMTGSTVLVDGGASKAVLASSHAWLKD